MADTTIKKVEAGSSPRGEMGQTDNQRTHCELEGRSICDRDGLKSRPADPRR